MYTPTASIIFLIQYKIDRVEEIGLARLTIFRCVSLNIRSVHSLESTRTREGGGNCYYAGLMLVPSEITFLPLSYVFLFYESRSSLFLNRRLVRRRTKKCPFGENCFVEVCQSVSQLGLDDAWSQLRCW